MHAEVELDNEINSPEVYNDPDLLRQKSDELSDLRFHQEELLPHGKPLWKSRKPTSRRSSPKNKGAYPLCLKITDNVSKNTARIALSGLLFALAMALSFIEGTLVIPGLLPGMKLGLANIVVMYALFFMGPRQALVLDTHSRHCSSFWCPASRRAFSLCGGLLSLAVM
ncbi:MAG: Gx transporter family protein, partial [Faecalibacterium sp.]